MTQGDDTKSRGNTTARAFCFTCFDTEEFEKIKTWDKTRYVIGGEEICPTTDKKHIQGYLECNTAVRFAALKKLAPKTHWETRKGTREQAVTYCKKDGAFSESGSYEAGGQGARTDIQRAKAIIMETGKFSKVIEEVEKYTALKYAQLILPYVEPKRTWKPTVTWITGPTGCGKSKLAWEMMGEDAYCKSDSSKWWDGYDGHDNVIIDDFRDSNMNLSDLLTLIDRYPRRVEYKGGSRQFLAMNIVITSIFKPEDLYGNARGEPIQQLLRRIDEVIDLGTRKDEIDNESTESLDDILGEY